MERPSKRLRVTEDVTDDPPAQPSSLHRAISPPARKKSKATTTPSPFQLTHIRDLPDSSNADTVTLKDLLGDPLISECWEFNFLHDIPFLMSHFDKDTRDLVKVHVVHGFWKREDGNRMALQEEAAAWKNLELHNAPMPEMFGTHHTKMMILFRYDDTAQVIIHTANMIAKDWTNMTNGVWRSPLLPLGPQPDSGKPEAEEESEADEDFGSGRKFKSDLLSYLRAYDAQKITLRPLTEQLVKYDFAGIRAVFIASVPGRHAIHDTSQTAWGWPALKRALRCVPVQAGKSEVVVQISSIATLGGTDSWLQKCLFDSLSLSKGSSISPRPAFRVVFLTADEIRRSLDGYASGGSIHTKIASPQQAKQLAYLKPIFCHWANDAPGGKEISKDTSLQDAGRQRAAPHIKTYIRYGTQSIDWALLTSANLSKQAWGEAASAAQEVRIASWEAGVLVWPSLVAGTDEAIMVGTFKTDAPGEEAPSGAPSSTGNVVGLRMPYSLPLQLYGKDEIPWVASNEHTEPDWAGRVCLRQ
ncbi:tyrosyl-DNA phosphodiesterase like protein [Verticillium longisporum]|nr:tyrosyl-DNA phosphodiesterase like protein [Verticillium longisporum]